MTDVVILVPRRSHPERDHLWTFARAWWSEAFPDWPIVEGWHHADEGPFNRSLAINRAAAEAGDWQVAVIIDADVLPTVSAIHGAVAVARAGLLGCGFHLRRHLTAKGTERVLAGDRSSWDPWVKLNLQDSVSGAVTIGRDLWDRTGGFDDQFIGWGWEDVAFKLAAETLSGYPMVRTAGALWHLWHPTSPERNEDSPQFAANRDRCRLYRAAKGNPDAMAELVGGRPPRRSRPRWDTTIPEVLHRTVPSETSDEVERWWERACELHPGWAHMTHRDPLDPDEWPETADLWPKCRSGAQKAGLIRLEALWRWGGVYIDSDVELYRPLDALLTLPGFSGWEDRKVAPDAVLGAAPGHPAVALMLQLARAEIEAGGGAWASGPGVTTAVLPGRSDWLLLPPGAFFPYHYTEKTQRRSDNHAQEQPWAFGAHHWHHSWRGR